MSTTNPESKQPWHSQYHEQGSLLAHLQTGLSAGSRLGLVSTVWFTAWLLRWLVDDILGDRNPFMFFYLPIALSAFLLGWRVAVAVAVAAYLVSDWFFISPRHKFGLWSDKDGKIISLMGFTFVSGVMIVLSEAMRRTGMLALKREVEARALLGELTRDRELLQTIIDAVPAMITMSTPDSGIIKVNREFERLIGWNSEEVAGVSLLEQCYPDPFYRDAVRRFMQSDQQDWMDIRMRTRDNQDLDTTWSNIRLSDQTQVSIGIDITARKIGERARTWLAAIVESSDDAIVSKDLDGIITSWNRGAENVFGYPAEEVIGRPITILLPPERLSEEVDILSAIRSDKKISHHESIRRRKDGKLIDVSLSISPIKDEQGKIVGASKIARDITDRRTQERELERRASQQQALYRLADRANHSESLDDLYETAIDSLLSTVSCDRASVLLFDESDVMRFRAWRGLSAEYRKGTEGHSPWRPDERNAEPITIDNLAFAKLDEQLREVIENEGIRALAFIPLINQGKLLGKFMVYYNQPHAFATEEMQLAQTIATQVGLAIVRKQVEAERERLLEREHAARHLAEGASQLKDQFLATLSHELRNPLNVIVGYADILARSAEARESTLVKKASGVIHRNASSQARLVSDLLDLSRLQNRKLSINRAPVSLPEIILDAMETVRHDAANKNISLHLSVPDEPLILDADGTRVEQIAWNLLNNAVRFTPEGGEVRLELVRNNGEASFSVSDTGEGIDPNFLPHVFDMFRQADASTSRRHGGMGIGLALVRELVELHGGRVDVESKGLGHGARFSVTLPINKEREQKIPTPTPTFRGSLSGVRVLVVDDSVETIEMLAKLLEMDGAEVTIAASGEEALRVVEEKTFDLLISDISMPAMDGYELLSKLRANPRTESLPAIALTGFGQSEDVARAEMEGFQAHLTKPLDVNELLKLALVTMNSKPVKIESSI